MRSKIQNPVRVYRMILKLYYFPILSIYDCVSVFFPDLSLTRAVFAIFLSSRHVGLNREKTSLKRISTRLSLISEHARRSSLKHSSLEIARRWLLIVRDRRACFAITNLARGRKLPRGTRIVSILGKIVACLPRTVYLLYRDA